MIKRLKLSREAILFDSPLYLIKAFMGVMVCYLVFSHHGLIGKDMVSVLFGMMLTLEPVNISGIKSGVAQIEATLLGGLVTAAIIAIAGVNWLTVPLGVMMTLYISILLDWKNISPVAFFTSIYMTQLLQYAPDGTPSVLLTFQLRILALGAGVLVAVLLNFIFSILFYRKMVTKRTIYVLMKLGVHMQRLETLVKEDRMGDLEGLKRDVSALFTEIDFIHGHIKDLDQENRQSEVLKVYSKGIGAMRLFNHYFYDWLLVIESTTNPSQLVAEIEGLDCSIQGLLSGTRVPLADMPEEGSDHALKLNACLKSMVGSIIQ